MNPDLSRGLEAPAGSALEVLPLPVAMIEPGFWTLLVTAIGSARLLETGLPAAGKAAIALPTITVRAEKEHGAALAAQANP